MADINVTNLGELLKRIYASWDIEDLLNLTHPALATMFAEGSASLGGEGFFFPVRAVGNFAHAYIGENGALPTGQFTVVKQAKVNPKVHAGVATLTGLSMAMSSGDAAAFARAYDENVQELIRSMTQYSEGCAFRDGFGKLATVLVDPGALAANTNSLAGDFDDVSMLNIGMSVNILTSAGVLRQGPIKITNVDWSGGSGGLVAFDTALVAAVAVGDVIQLADSQTTTFVAGTDEIEPIGVEGALLASGTYLGVSRAISGGSPTWRANTFAANSLFDEEILQRARTRLTQVSGIQLSGMSGRFKLVCHPMQGEILARLAIPRVQYSGMNGVDLLNSTEVKIGGIPLVTSYLCPPKKAYLGDWKYASSLYPPTGKLHIDTEFNGSALKWLSGFDRGQVFVKEYRAFAVRRPNCFVRITDLTEATR